MSCLSDASTPCSVIYHIYRNKSLYGSAIKSIRLARNYHSAGKKYFFYFRNPSTGAITMLSGARILRILCHPNTLNYCSSEERCAGLVLLNAAFFARVLLAFNQATQAKTRGLPFSKHIDIPASLFPNVPSSDRSVTVPGQNYITIMFLAIGGAPLSGSGFT